MQTVAFSVTFPLGLRFDLRALLGDVKDSEVFVLLQSAGVLTRPWCLLEIFTAITNQVPIVCVNVAGPNSYDFSAASTFMTHLDTELDIANPGASKLIRDQGVDMVQLAYLLAHTIPSCISVDFNPVRAILWVYVAHNHLAI